MHQLLDKRPFDSRLYDVDCSDLLDPDEVIVSASAPVADGELPLPNPPPDPAPALLTFGTPVVNQAPVYYPLEQISRPPGKVIQVLVTGGYLPDGYPELVVTLRLRFVTSLSPALEATVCLRLTDADCAC